MKRKRQTPEEISKKLREAATQLADAKARLKTAQDDLEAKLDAKYPTLTEADIQTLVVDDKWQATPAAAVQGELDRVSQTLTGRTRTPKIRSRSRRSLSQQAMNVGWAGMRPPVWVRQAWTADPALPRADEMCGVGDAGLGLGELAAD